MKIAAIKTTPLALAFKEPYHWAGRADYAAAVVLVEVETDDGLVGVGESVAAFPAEGTVAALQGVAPLFIGQPVFDVERLVTGARHLGSFNHTPWQANFVLAGLEMALWDILGKAAGWPVHRLLGGAVRDEVDYFGFVQGDTTNELAEDARELARTCRCACTAKVCRASRTARSTTSACARPTSPRATKSCTSSSSRISSPPPTSRRSGASWGCSRDPAWASSSTAMRCGGRPSCTSATSATTIPGAGSATISQRRADEAGDSE